MKDEGWIWMYETSYIELRMKDHDQLPVGLKAQLVEHRTGIAEVMGSNPVQAWIFSGFPLFTTA